MGLYPKMEHIYKGEKGMDWFTIMVGAGMLVTLFIVFLLLKEFKKSIKESKEGKVSGRCELD